VYYYPHLYQLRLNTCLFLPIISCFYQLHRSIVYDRDRHDHDRDRYISTI